MKTKENSLASKPGHLSQIKILALAGFILPAATGLAQTLWITNTQDYNNPANWNGTFNGGSNPNTSNDNGSNNVVLIRPGDPAWQHGDTLAGNGASTSGAYLQTGSTNNTGGGNWLRMGIGSGSFGSYILSNGVVNVGGRTQIGENGVGYLEIDGGIYNGNVNDLGANPAMVCGQGDFGPGTGTLVINGGTVTYGQETWFGEQGGSGTGTGYFFMNGGTLNVNNWFVFGRHGGAAGAHGQGVMTGGTINFHGGGQFLIGGGGVGSLAQSGGTINAFNQYLIPESDGGSGGMGTNTLSGNAVLNVHDWLAVGRNAGHGELNISGNAAINRDGGGSHFDIGASGLGVVNQTGGTITESSSDVWLGENSAGTWNLESGSAFLGNLIMCINGGATATLNLDGGLLQASGISSSSIGISTLNFNGGVLQANANNANFISGISFLQVGAGGAVIDSHGFNITIPGALVDNGGGGLTKIGNGTLLLSGANSYIGTTLVNAGVLEIGTSSTGGGSVTVSDNAGFGPLTQVANGQLNVASLTMGSSTGASFNFDVDSFGNPSSAPLNVVGTFTANGTTTVNVADGLPQVGQFPLVQYGTRAGSGKFVIGSLPVGVTANIVTNGNSLALNITVVNLPRWDGNAGGNWDIGLTTNWINIGTGLPTTYGEGNAILFDDNASGTTNVNLVTTVHPRSVTVNNTSLNYNFTGSGSISGSTSLSKSGAGTLSIANANGYTGPTLISGGTLSVASLANGGSPSPIGASSASPTNLVLNDATFQYTGAPVAANRGFNIANTNSVIDAEGNFTLSGLVTAASGSAFVKTGPAQFGLTTVGNNEFSGGYNPGVQVVAGTLLLNGSSGGQTNHTQNEMWVGSTPTSGASLVLTNTTLHVDSWLGLGRINGGINNTSTVTLYNSTMTVGNLSLGWDGGQPGNLSSQFITLNGNSAFTNFGSVNLAEGANASFSLNINSNSVFWVQNPFYICLANNTTGSVVVANSGKLVQANGWFDIGNGGNCVASLLARDSASVSLDGDCNLADTAAGAMATLTVQDNATLHANNLFVGKSSGSVCTANIAGSAGATFGNFIRLADGSGSTGNLNISGGSLTASQYINMAAGSGSTANVTISGGNLTGGNDMTVGDQGTAVVNMNGGVLTLPNTLYLSRGSGVANGTVNLNAGGTIVTGNINNGWAFNEGTNSPTFNPNAFNFNGGTLKAVGTYSYIFPNVNTVVQAGGAVIDDNGHIVEMGAALVNGGGGGGLTKLNTGTLLLEGVNTYTGTTLVSAGALAGVGSIAGPVTVSSGAGIGAGAGSIGTLTINNTLTLSAGSTSFFRLDVTTNDLVTGLTSVGYGGALVVSNTTGVPLATGGSFKLFNSSSPGTGNFTSVTVLPSGTGTFNPSTGILTITASPTFNSPHTSGGNFIMTGFAAPNTGYTLLTATNLATPKAQWTTSATGTTDSTGFFSNSIPHNGAQQFFRMRQP
jgi:autotransporter-associated beta strand protein